MLLTVTDVADVTGVMPHNLTSWCERGFVKPVVEANGPGNHRQFTITQALGVAVANAVRASERGCALSFVSNVVEGFGKLTEQELLKKFDKGATHLMFAVRTGSGATVVLDGPQPDRIDVRGIYRNVKKKIDRLAQEPGNARGRNRGLAGAALNT
jgi:hypothetical protein